MAATRQGIAALEGRMVASNIPRSLLRARGGRLRGVVLMMPTSKSFRAFRTIKKSSPRLTRSTSTRVVRRMSTISAAMGDNNNNNFFMSSKSDREDDVVMRRDPDEGVAVGDDDEGAAAAAGSTSAVVETVNAVLEDIVDGQRYIKETGRTKARPMKRRALVVSLALGALRGPIDDVDNRLGSLRRTTSTSRLARTPSSTGFARTAHLLTQLSFGSPH